MIKIEATTTEVVTGITITLSNDDATHLSHALNCCHGDAYAYREQKWKNTWPWLSEFVKKLDEARGEGCTMGPRKRQA